MKIFYNFILILSSIILFAFASLQFNDPDPLIWISLYGSAAIVILLFVVNKSVKILFWVAFFLALYEIINSASGAFMYFQHMKEEPLMQTMNLEKPYIEECREFLGACIDIVLLGLSSWIFKLKQKI